MELRKYREFCRIVENIVYRCGIWPHLEETGPLYRLIGYYGLFSCFVIGTKALVNGLNNIANVTVLVRALRGVIALYTPMIRMISYLVHRKELTFLDKELAAAFEDKLKNEKNQPALLSPISLYTNLMQSLSLCTGATALMYYLPYVIIIFKHKKYVQVFQGKYPFPVEPKGLLYWIIFVFESSGLWYIYHATTGVDNAFGMHCFRITGFLRLASERFGNLHVGDPIGKNQLRECVQMHQLVLRAKVSMQKVFGVVILWSYLISSIVICSLLWQANKMKDRITVFRIFSIAVYIIMKLLQSLIYAYYGSSVTAESEKYQEAIYHSSWPGSGNVTLMKELLIIRTQRTVSLKACGFFLITMQYFEKICNTSITYFYLIETIDSKH